jgi:MMP 1-O-methyltransferase
MIDGMMQEGELELLRGWAKSHKKILEIGSWHGQSTRALADNTPGIVYAVDTWNGALDDLQKVYYTSHKNNYGDHAFMQFCKNNGDLIDKGKIIPIRMRSTNANWVLHTLGIKFDMIWIDGDHAYEAVKSDIIGTSPLLENGALLCGHDYLAWCGVKQAVDELIGMGNFKVDYSIWHTTR